MSKLRKKCILKILMELKHSNGVISIMINNEHDHEHGFSFTCHLENLTF